VIRVLIVDDEPLARDTLRIVLASDPDVEIVGACSGVDAPALVAAARPEILFLDVEMPALGGFDVIDKIGVAAVPIVVFVTAHTRYAVQAFEVHAFDYLLKPFDDRRLLDSLARAKLRLGARDRPYVQRFVVRGRDSTLLVEAASVDWIEAADDYVELHVGAVSHIVRERIAELDSKLDPRRFVRIHRSTIVNLERVRATKPMIRGDAIVVLADGSEHRLSRSRRDEFQRRVTGAMSSSPQPRDGSPQMR